MKTILGIAFVCISILPLIFSVTIRENSKRTVDNNTVHLFILLVPNSAVEGIRNLRQEEAEDAIAGAVSFAQTGQYLGQIIQGVLGGDVRPIFAGSVKFVDDQTVQSGLGGFLQSIGPAVNLALREIYTRGQVAFGYGPTTSRAVAATAFPHNETLIDIESTNITMYEGNQTTRPLLVKTTPKPTSAWEYVLSQIQNEYMGTTTVEPLPFLTSKPASGGEDYDGDYQA